MLRYIIIQCTWNVPEQNKQKVKTYLGIVLRHKFSLVYVSKAFFHKEGNSDI